MPQATFHFPLGFLWGTATAAYQVEGNNLNANWWHWEQQPGRIVEDQKSGLACDWWGGRWREDFDRAADSGQNAHRMSVEWSRIQPAPDRWDENAIDHYREMVRYLVERRLHPIVTLHHYTDPQWLTEMGGWENEQAVVYFEKYVRKVVDALRDYVSTWVTTNEPNGYIANGYVLGEFPPGKKDLMAGMRAMVNLIRGHAAAYHAIHSIQRQARVGYAHLYRGFAPRFSWFPPDRLAAYLQFTNFNNLFPSALVTGVAKLPFQRVKIPAAKGTQDFFGLNYYTKDLVAFNLLKPAELFGRRYYPRDAELSDNGFIASQPAGFYEAIKWANQFSLPIIITENGVENSEDSFRRRYLLTHMHQVWRAANFNWPVKGFMHWTLVDNFEWSSGWKMRFGLWELNPETQARRKRPSADMYAEICRENGISSEMVTRYAPEIYEQLFPV